MQTPHLRHLARRLGSRALAGLLLSLMTLATLAADPGWTGAPGLLNTMTVHAVVRKPDGTYLTMATPGSRLAAFKGAECRGSTVLFNGPAANDQFQLSVASNAANESGITLKVWDAGLDRVFDINEGFSFVADTTLGQITAPSQYTLLLTLPTATPAVADPVVVAEAATTAFAVTVSGGIEPYTYAWTVGGVAAGGNSPTFDYTPGFGTVVHPAETAATPVVCTVTDAAGTPATVTATWADVTVTDVDRLPTAPVVDIDQAAPTTTDPLTYTSTTPATDADGDAITYVTSWTNGTTTLSTLGLAAANTRKGETWTATVFARTNPYGLANVDSAVDTDAVVIQNTPPVAVAPTVSPLPAFSSNNVLPVLDGTDADETDGVDTLAFAILDGTLGALRTAKGGTLSSFNAATGAVQYTPATGFSGDDSFQFTVTDGTAVSAAATVSISVFPPLMEIAVAGAGVDTIELGADAAATDSADAHLDHLAPPHYEGIGSVRFITPGDGEFLKRDLRPTFAGQRFQIEIQAGTDDAVILSWDPTDLITPAGLGWHLWQLDGLDGDPIPGTAIDMSLVTQTVAVPADPEGDDAPVYFEIGVPGTVTLTAVSPATGLPAGGTLVTLTGTGFLPGAAVTFGGDAGTAVTVAPLGTTLTVLTPARVFSLVAVTVTNGDGGAATLANAFRYNTAPTASASGPYTVDLCADLTLSGSTSADPDTASGDVLTYAWDLDSDGAYDDAVGVAPTVPNATIITLGLGVGPHTIRLRVTDSASVLATAATTLTLTNALPVASHGGPYVIDLGSSLALNAAGSADANTACGDVLTYAWDLDNDGAYGEAGEPTTAAASLTAATLASLGFPTASPFTGLPKRTIRVRVSDANGGVATASTTVTIYENTPVADFTVTPAGGHAEFDEVVRFDPAPSYHGSPLHSMVKYEWDFNYDGSFTAMQTTTTKTHVGYIFGRFGTFTVALRVTDSNTSPQTALVTRVVSVDQGNNPPTVDAGGPYSIAVTTALILNGSGTDPDLGFGDVLAYAWDLDNDGAYDDATGATPTLSAAAVTALSLPENVANTIRVQVTDFGGLTAIDTATLTLTNDPNADPTAWLFTFDVEFGSEAQLRIGVNPGATDLEDAAFDAQAALPTLSLAFSAVHPSTTAVELSTAINRSNADVDGDGDTDVYADWLIELSAGVNAPLVLTWDSARVPAVGMWLIEVEPGSGATVPDVDARIAAGTPRIDMSQEDTLVVGLGETRFYRVIYGFLDFDLPLAEGWNMFALPVEPFDTAIANVLTDGLPGLTFPNSIYGYDSATGAYFDATDLYGLPGYWVYAMRDAAVTIRGIRISDRKVDLAGTEKWHMVGVAAERALETNASLWLPGYWWNAAVGQYETVLAGESLAPGIAYWFYGLASTQLNP